MKTAKDGAASVKLRARKNKTTGWASPLPWNPVVPHSETMQVLFKDRL